MMNGRHFRFWLVTFLVLAACLWLLRDVLLPFVAGIALAYVYAPIADRMERARNESHRGGAADRHRLHCDPDRADVLLLVPLLLQQGSALISHIPGYFKRVKDLIADSNLPWLSTLMGPGDANETVSGLVSQVATWLLSFVYSIWTGGKALVSFASVLIVMPVVTFYLIRDWHSMIEMRGQLGAGAPA